MNHQDIFDIQSLDLYSLREMCDKLALGVPESRGKKPYREALQTIQRADENGNDALFAAWEALGGDREDVLLVAGDSKPEAAPAAVDEDAAEQFIEALGRLVKPALDEDAIRQIVAHEVAKGEARIERIVVTPAGEVNLGSEHVHPAFEEVLSLAGLGENVLLVGPAGTGKTHMAAQVAKALGREFGSISCTAGMSEAQLLGYLLPTGDGGKFEYQPSQFVHLYENGGVFLGDELDASDANTLVVLNAALANGEFFLPQRFGNQRVVKHPDFVFIGAANTFGTGGDMLYSARERLDAATLDRFTTVEVGYDETLERKIVAPEILEFGRGVRQAIENYRLRRVMSTRRMISMSRQMAAGHSFARVIGRYLSTWATDERAKL